MLAFSLLVSIILSVKNVACSMSVSDTFLATIKNENRENSFTWCRNPEQIKAKSANSSGSSIHSKSIVTVSAPLCLISSEKLFIIRKENGQNRMYLETLLETIQKYQSEKDPAELHYGLYSAEDVYLLLHSSGYSWISILENTTTDKYETHNVSNMLRSNLIMGDLFTIGDTVGLWFSHIIPKFLPLNGKPFTIFYVIEKSFFVDRTTNNLDLTQQKFYFRDNYQNFSYARSLYWSVCEFKNQNQPDDYTYFGDIVPFGYIDEREQIVMVDARRQMVATVDLKELLSEISKGIGSRNKFSACGNIFVNITKLEDYFGQSEEAGEMLIYLLAFLGLSMIVISCLVLVGFIKGPKRSHKKNTEERKGMNTPPNDITRTKSHTKGLSTTKTHKDISGLQHSTGSSVYK